MRWRAALPLLLVGLGACAPSCGRDPDKEDQRAVRRICALPDDAVVTRWQSSPSGRDRWQREGLTIRGEVRVPLRWSPIAASYHELPWPEARGALERDLGMGEALDERRWALCRTAGTNILEPTTSTRDCADAPRLADAVVCVVEPQLAAPGPLVVRVEVRTKY